MIVMPVDDHNVSRNTCQSFGSEKTTKTCTQDDDLWHKSSLSIWTEKSRCRRLSLNQGWSDRVFNQRRKLLTSKYRAAAQHPYIQTNALSQPSI